MRLCLVISSLGAGGAERVMSVLANEWAAKGKDVTLITLDSSQNDFFAIDPRVRRVGLDLLKPSQSPLQAAANNLARVGRLRSAIRRARPHVVISFMDRTNVLTLLASSGLKAPVIAAEHTNPRHADTGPVWGALRRLLYPRAGLVMAVSQEGADFVGRFVPASKVMVMPNPAPHDVRPDLGLPAGDWPDLPRTVVGMGRLSKEKGFDLLIEAFGICAKEHPQWRLLVLGEGPERKRLQGLVKSLGLEGKTSLPGNISRPYGLLGRSGVFVMPSRFEGFPCALVEAMACGLPVVATDCTSAVAEILEGGRAGMTAPLEDAAGLAECIMALMADEPKRRELAGRAEKACRRFSVEAIMARWEPVLEKMAGRA